MSKITNWLDFPFKNKKCKQGFKESHRRNGFYVCKKCGFEFSESEMENHDSFDCKEYKKIN